MHLFDISMVLLGAISQEDENLMRGATKTLEEVIPATE